MKKNNCILPVIILLSFFFSKQSFSQSTLMDLIPSSTATHTAVQSGSWFDASTWDVGTIPDDAAIVMVPMGMTVNYEGQSDAHIFAIRVDGEFLCTQTNSIDTTKIIFDTFVGTMMSKVQFHANTSSHGYIDVSISPFDIEAHKSGTSGYSQIWNANAISHYSDGATTYEVTYYVGPDRRFKNYALALNGNTSVTELTRNLVDDGVGVLGRHDWDSTQLSLGLTSMGEIEVIGQEKSTMAKLSADAPRNQTSIQLETSPQGWNVGDEILVTRGGNINTSSNGTETAIINTISGNTITVTQDLTKNHEGRMEDDLHCYTGNLNRNIIFHSTNPGTISQRGHFMAMHNPINIQIKNAAFLEMGRTDKSRLLDDLIWSHWVEPTTFQSYVSALGQECSELIKNPKQDITNHRGRYSIHIHRAGATNGTNMAQVTGNVVRGNPGWAITHHDANANVSENVVYDVVGGGIVSEVGNETGFWDNNLVVDIRTGHGFDGYESFLFYGDYLFSGQGLAMKGRGVICRGNVIVEASQGIGIMNMSATINSTIRMDSEAFATFRPSFNFDQFPLDKNGYSKEGDGIIPQEIPLVFENTTTIWCAQGINSIERDPGVNHESRSVFDNFKVWGANWGLRINYQADYSFRDVFISGKNANSQGIVMYKHAHNMVYDRIKLVDLKYGVVASLLHEAGSNVKTRNTSFSPWIFIDLELENVGKMYDVDHLDFSATGTVLYDEHPDNAIHLSFSDLPTTRGMTFTLNQGADLEIDLATNDLQFRIDGAITDKIGTYEFGITQAPSMDALRVDYDERIYEFASQAKLEEYLSNNVVYKDTSDNDQLYFIINEYIPDRVTYEYVSFPIRIKIMNAPNSGVYASPAIEDPINFEPKNQLISRMGTATQSSTSLSESFHGVSIDPNASRALDGSNNGRKNSDFYQLGMVPIGSSAITQVELEPWWDLDLGETKIIEYIDIWNTVDMQGEDIETASPYFRNFYVLVSDTPFGNMDLATAKTNATYEFYKDENPIRWLALNDLNITGRYIRIQAEGYTKIGIAEVDVIGRDISTKMDCNGDIAGLAYLDNCEICVEGNTGLEPCEIDCADVWGGTAYIDDCGTCIGGTIGLTSPVEIPCNGIDDDCNPLTLDALAIDDTNGDGICDINETCIGDEPNAACTNGLLCISGYTINNDCNCTGPASNPSGLTNLALGKTATQSSTNSGGEASRAVDGNTDGVFTANSVTHTGYNMNAWWEVDLESIQNIGLINIYNRTDCCLARLTNFHVLISDVPFVSTNLNDVLLQSEVSSYYLTDYPNSNTSIAINHTGQYIRVQLDGQHFLSLAEVEIIEQCICNDTDNDGVCDSDDVCAGEDDTIDSDNDGIPDGCDTCNNDLIGTNCNDGNDCTYNDLYQSDCTCAGTLYYDATQKMINGSFETGDFESWTRLTNWTTGTTNISIDNTNPYCDGSHAITYNGGAVYEQLYADFTNLVIGDNYTLYFQMAGATADSYIGSTYDIYSGIYTFVDGGGSSTYVQQSIPFVATENTMRIWFDFYPNTSVLLDAFSFEDNSCSTCNDGIQNGDEKNIDCGGTSCRPCVEGCQDVSAHNYMPLAERDFCFCETCDDDKLNGDEVETDCGGSKCLPCATLPVELIIFEGELINKETLLEWTTATEENVKGFEIQRSRDAFSWETLGFVSANNTGSEYGFWDRQPYGGLNYYRLKIVDFDNSYEYSKIVTVELKSKSSLEIYPNPTKNYINLEVEIEPNSVMELELWDVLGRNVLSQQLKSDASGKILETLKLPSLPTATYYLKCTDGSNNWNIPIIIE